MLSVFKINFHFQERKSENSVKIHFLKRINLHDFGCYPAQPVLLLHCQRGDFGLKNRSVLSKILIGFYENPLELGEIEGDSRTRIFTAFSMRTGAESLENTAFSGVSHLPLSSVKFRQVRFLPLDSKSGSRASGSWVRIPPCPPQVHRNFDRITVDFSMPENRLR